MGPGALRRGLRPGAGRRLASAHLRVACCLSRRETRGLAAGSPWPCDFGPDLSRGFRALKTWFTLKVHGADAIGATIAHSCALAQYLEQRIRAEASLELLAPAQLNIVGFRYRAPDPDRINAEIVAELHE